MRVGFLQFRPRFGEPARNVKTVIRALRHAQADLIVLPELAFSGYYFAGRAEARALSEEPKRSLALASVLDLCREKKLHVVTGFAERARDRVFNSALLVGPRGIVHTYRKVHLFHEEKRWFDPGDRPLEVQTVLGARVGMMVCFDWIFPEVTRTLALQGMQILAHPSNLVLDLCQRAMFARSVENAVFTVTANRCGADERPHGTLRFTGASQILGPRGELLAQAPARGACVRVVELDPARARNKRITRRNDLFGDRRPKFYDVG
jgi:predicted amidohydrolase